jgi:cytochrome c553
MKRSAQFLAFGMLMAGMLAIGSVPTNAAPAAGVSDDLRAAVATPQDIAEGKRVADASCARCHGMDGIGTAKGVPHIAGQRPAYIYLELKVYQTGGRGDIPMGNVVKYMNDDALMKVSAYYASLEPAQPSAAGGVKATASKSDPVSAGKAAAAGCAGCHGEAGISKTPGMPSLVGLDPKYMIAALNAYKNGQRKHDMMKTLVSALGEADLNNIALYYALQKPGKAQTAAEGKPAAGKAAAAACAGCHGDGGVSANPATPSIAGQDAQYFAAAMRAYKDGSRRDPTMKATAAALDETAIRDLAAFYATQPPQAPKVRKPLTTAEWVQRCDRCHGINGNSTDPRSPALAAQKADYLEQVLHAYRKGTRKSPQMAAMSDVLSEEDVAGLATYYARQKPRAVVYVALPCK